MFCQKCGTQLLEDAVFCEKCGNKVGNVKEDVKESENVVNERIDDNEVLLELKPIYKFAYKLLPNVLALTFIFLIFLLPLIIATCTDGYEDVGAIFIITYLFISVSIIAVKYLINVKQYECYDYDFYKTKVIYKDGFLNRSEKEVKYKHIREVTMRQTFMQRLFNIGTIILYTNAETGFGNGIDIIDLENVEEKYKEVKKIINM